ncbi:chemotaxis protein CheW [Lacticigenium naphthae]|uniref:chemotaxis protein CheW n=1 Tax=Lacticigenium naphthae TaxID=515351 RepID=UPI0003FD24A0|nr:chemotaxis protein CheW [Lacticigenium naphthae]
MQLIVFTLHDRFYGIPTKWVEEITTKLTSTLVPQSPEWVEGLINLRGQVMTLVNLDRLLNSSSDMERICYNNTIVIQTEQNKVAVEVEEVIGVTTVTEEEIQPIVHSEDTWVTSLVPAYGEVVSIIDIHQLFLKNEGE